MQSYSFNCYLQCVGLMTCHMYKVIHGNQHSHREIELISKKRKKKRKGVQKKKLIFTP